MSSLAAAPQSQVHPAFSFLDSTVLEVWKAFKRCH
jgi:hypothetical protein